MSLIWLRKQVASASFVNIAGSESYQPAQNNDVPYKRRKERRNYSQQNIGPRIKQNTQERNEEH